MAIEKVAIIGAGTMGHGIAQVAAQAGYTVTLEDVTEEFVSRGLSLIKDNLKKGVERGKVSEKEMNATISRIRTSTNLKDAAGADLIIEAVIEKLDAKR